MLYSPEAFEPLTRTRWSEERALAGIRDIVEDAEHALRGATRLWRADTWDGWRATSPLKNLYVGAAGVLWALESLRRRGQAETTLDLPFLAQRALELFRERPDYVKGFDPPDPRESGLMGGETGILLVAYRLTPARDLDDALLARVRANVGNEAGELFWGVPGTLHAARTMLDWTGEERWEAAWRESADALWSRRGSDGLWLGRLWGRQYRGFTASHGLVGNVLSLLRGGDLLGSRRRSALVGDTNAILACTAVCEGGRANWPTSEGRPLEGLDGEIRLQWCVGAPGIVISAADYLDEELLLAGAGLTWTAGPHGLEKGACICHGTAGNGYALLKTFARTGDELWLRRARRFAVHALEQVGRLRADRGRGRYSLWTGDLGVAMFAADCIEATASYPVLDSSAW